MPRFPDFYCIGAQKAGTTWLHKMLEMHPDVWLPALKELHYFDRVHIPHRTDEFGLSPLDRALLDKALDGIRWHANREGPPEERIICIQKLVRMGRAKLTDRWYSRIFDEASDKSLCGEIDPGYASLPDPGVAHMRRLNDHAKIILIMRDPIERAWSHLRMDEAKGHLGRDGYVAWAQKNQTWFSYSDYPSVIARFAAHFSLENILLLHFDEIREEPILLLNRVCDFLGLDFARGKFSGAHEVVFEGRAHPMPRSVYDIFLARLRPVYEKLLSLDSPYVRRWYQRHFTA